MALGGGSSVPPSLLTHTSKSSVGGLDVTSDPIDTTGASLIVVGICTYGQPYTLADSQTNTWQALTQYNNGVQQAQLFKCLTPITNAAQTFTVTHTASAPYPSIYVACFSGITSYDQESGTYNAGSATLQPGSITPPSANALLVTLVSGNETTSSIDGGFIKTDGNALVGANAVQGAMAYLIQTSPAAANPTWTLNGSAGISAAMASFLP